MKKVTEELRYDGATIEQVARDAGRPRLPPRRLRLPGVLRNTVTIGRDERRHDRRQIDQCRGRRAASRRSPRSSSATRSTSCQRGLDVTGKGEIRVTIPGKPGQIAGTALLTGTPTATTETVDLFDRGRTSAARRRQIEGLIADCSPRPYAPSMRLDVSAGAYGRSWAGFPGRTALPRSIVDQVLALRASVAIDRGNAGRVRLTADHSVDRTRRIRSA